MSVMPEGPLYRWLLGERYAQLPAVIRRMHDVAPIQRATGFGTVTHGDNPASRALARLLGLPRPGVDKTLRVTLSAEGGVEVLSRSYPDATLVTVQSPAGPAGSGLLGERFGPFTLWLQLDVAPHGLSFTLCDVRVHGRSLPSALWPRLVAHETAEGDWYRFFVRIVLPGLGLLIQYEGRLEVVEEAPHA